MYNEPIKIYKLLGSYLLINFVIPIFFTLNFLVPVKKISLLLDFTTIASSRLHTSPATLYWPMLFLQDLSGMTCEWLIRSVPKFVCVFVLL